MNKKYTKAQILEVSLKYNSLKEFKEKDSAMYWTIYNYGVAEEVRKLMEERNTKKEIERLTLSASAFSTKRDFRKERPNDYKAAFRLGIIEKICSHMTKLKQERTYELLKKEALKFSSRKEFELADSAAYHAAHKKGFLDDICSHMEYILYPWSNEELEQIAKKYNTIGDFLKESPNVYQSAWRRGILKEITSHMEMIGTISAAEIHLFDFIKSIYPETQKLRDRKVKIQDKPYIKGFDLDIYLLNLKKGIEFDGTYWHSFEHMRKSKGKRLWSDSDILNYHELKDSWFASKGIQILHIKEEDWNRDKEECIQKCLDFLGKEDVKAA